MGADTGISKSEVSRICADLDTEVGAFRDRSLTGQAFPYVFLDATYCKARVNRRVVSQAVVVATGVRADGWREVLGFAVGDSEDGAFWTAFLRSLKARGLGGVQLVISDAHTGLKAAIAGVLLGASWQRCRVHFLRNVLAAVPKGNAEMVAPPWLQAPPLPGLRDPERADAQVRGQQPGRPVRHPQTQIAGFTELVATAIANAEAHEELQALADEQAALRRVATRVARGESPAAVFAAVAEEVGRLLPADFAVIGRYEPDGAGWTRMGGWSRVGEASGVGRTVPLGGESVAARVHETGRTVQMDSYESASGSLAADARAAGLGSSVGVPITVAGRLWGVMIASSTCETEFPAGTARRLADFTELVATAIANAEAHAEVTASRADRGHRRPDQAPYRA